MITTITRQTTAQQITDSYTAQHTDWVPLATIRAELAHIDPAELTRTLREMATVTHTAHVIPVANGRSLTAADRDAAVTLGGEDCHAIMIPGAVAYRGRHAK